MHRSYISHQRHYQHTAVSTTQIRQIEKELLLRLNAGIESVEVRPRRPEAFRDQFGASWKEFEAIATRHAAEIRKYYVVFMTEKKFTNRAECVCLDLFVRNQGHFGEPEPKEIILSGYNCHKTDFQTYCQIAEKILFLVPAPSSGPTSAEHGFLVDRLAVSIRHPALANAIKGPLSHQDYDGAVRAATVLVEHELRQRCLAAGREEAAAQTGADLSVTAFNDKNGCLTPPWPVASQAHEGAHLVFRGFFLHLRNAWGHNAIILGSNAAGFAETIEFCQYLLHVVAASAIR